MKETLFDEFVEKINSIDGLTKKSSEKILFDLIKNNKLNEIIDILVDIKKKIKLCSICGYLFENDKCYICDDENRNKNIIYVVSTLFDAMKINKTDQINTLYHILNGEININKKITPDKLNIDSLINRIVDNQEIVIGLNATFDGEITTNYLFSILENLNKNIKITRIAKGIPTGASLSYLDDITIENAFKNRIEYLKKK